MRGFLAEGPTAADGSTKRWRVYLNHALTDYYEVEEADDIVHWIDLGTEDEGQRIWLKHGAKTRYVRSRASEAEVPRLLGGRIAQTMMPVAQTAAPRWAPGTGQAGVPVQPGSSDWLPFDDDPGWEYTKCRAGCYSASP